MVLGYVKQPPTLIQTLPMSFHSWVLFITLTGLLYGFFPLWSGEGRRFPTGILKKKKERVCVWGPGEGSETRPWVDIHRQREHDQHSLDPLDTPD